MSRTAKSFVKVHQALSTNGNPSRKQARLALWGTILGDDTKAAVVEEIFSLLTSSSAHDETSSTASSCPSDVDELAPSGASVSRGDQKAETYTATGNNPLSASSRRPWRGDQEPIRSNNTAPEVVREAVLESIERSREAPCDPLSDGHSSDHLSANTPVQARPARAAAANGPKRRGRPPGTAASRGR